MVKLQRWSLCGKIRFLSIIDIGIHILVEKSALRKMKSKNKIKSDGKLASNQLILSENRDQPPIDKKKLAALEKERAKAEKNLKKGDSIWTRFWNYFER